jgi:hypothetical protein
MECAKSVLGVQLATRVIDSTAAVHFDTIETLQRGLFVAESEEAVVRVLIEEVPRLLALVGAFQDAAVEATRVNRAEDAHTGSAVIIIAVFAFSILRQHRSACQPSWRACSPDGK